MSVVALTGCQPDVPPTIFPPPLPRLKIEEGIGARALELQPAARALFEKASFPVFEADGFFVPRPSGISVDQVLQAVGFDAEAAELEIGKAQRVVLPRANFKELVMAACRVLPKKKGEPGKKKEKGGEARGLCQLAPEFQPSPALDKLLQTSYGVSVEQFKEIIERREDPFIYQQLRKIRPSEHPGCPDVPGKVPIEHMGVFAKSKVVAGRVITIAPEVTNTIQICRDQAAVRGKEALERIGNRLYRFIGEVFGIRGVSNAQTASNEVALLLLPYGETKKQDRRVLALRYVYRMPIVAEFRKVRSLFYVWLDAENGTIRELQPLLPGRSSSAVPAQGRTFNRHPGLSPRPTPDDFEVTPAADGYVLQLSGVFGRVDRYGDNIFDDEVKIPKSVGNPSPRADFDVSGLNNPSDEGFEEVDLLATLYRYRQMALSSGVFQPFPMSRFQIAFDTDSTDSSCGGEQGAESLIFSRCESGLRANQDHTVVAHEMGHLITVRQTLGRPADWCKKRAGGQDRDVSCTTLSRSVPRAFHDFADTWAHVFENTNCFGGWVEQRTDCAEPDEAGERPRKADPDVDHFPEHRQRNPDKNWPGYTGVYADMQIAAAALWAVRQGLLSKDPTHERSDASLLFLVRFMGTLPMLGISSGWPETSGLVGLSPQNSAELVGRTEIGDTDLDIYAGLFDLELQLANQWAGEDLQGDGMAHTMNKVTAGFARAGVFLIPVACLDGDSNTIDPLRCPDGESGGDAVIDVDDNDPTDDSRDPDGFIHPEWDYLKRGGGPPIFHVWTGPRYVFKNGTAELPKDRGKPAPCNTHFEITVGNGLDGAGKLTGNVTSSGPQQVAVAPQGDSGALCYGVWKIPPTDWDTLDDGERIYYTVKTWSLDATGGHIKERSSTEPYHGLFKVTPPFAVVNESGKPEGAGAPAGSS